MVPCDGEDVEELGLSYSRDGIESGITSVENSWAFLKRLKYVLTTPRYLPRKGNKST